MWLGWPCSVHDSKVLFVIDYMKSDDAGKGHLYFTMYRKGLVDAAFGPSKSVVPTDRSPQIQLAENLAYNTIHGSMSIKEEHVYGMVKCCLQGIREIRIIITFREDMVLVVKFLLAGCVIQKVCLDLTDKFLVLINWEISIRLISMRSMIQDDRTKRKKWRITSGTVGQFSESM